MASKEGGNSLEWVCISKRVIEYAQNENNEKNKCFYRINLNYEIQGIEGLIIWYFCTKWQN